MFTKVIRCLFVILLGMSTALSVTKAPFVFVQNGETANIIPAQNGWFKLVLNNPPTVVPYYSQVNRSFGIQFRKDFSDPNLAKSNVKVLHQSGLIFPGLVAFSQFYPNNGNAVNDGGGFIVDIKPIAIDYQQRKYIYMIKQRHTQPNITINSAQLKLSAGTLQKPTILGALSLTLEQAEQLFSGLNMEMVSENLLKND